MTVRLNLGGGRKEFEGWINVDLDERFADIVADVRAVPLPDEHADEIAAIHVLEHIERWDAPDTLREWHRLLKHGGKIAIELPELYKCCRMLLNGADPDNSKGALRAIYGDPSAREPRMMHRWCWSEEELKRELETAGFIKIRMVPPVYHGRRAYRDIRAEAIKP